MNFKNESQVDIHIADLLRNMGLELGVDFDNQNSLDAKLKAALEGASKSLEGKGGGIPDFTTLRYSDENGVFIPVLIEDKLHTANAAAEDKLGVLKQDQRSINKYALNGALHYARAAISSGLFSEIIAVGIAADSPSDIQVDVLYVYGTGLRSYKKLPQTTLEFLESQKAFATMLSNARLSEADKHRILVDSRAELHRHAKRLNNLMHELNITAPQRVLFVSGMLLAMQDLEDGGTISPGLRPKDLHGSSISKSRDGRLIVDRISSYLEELSANRAGQGKRAIPLDKLKLMIDSFSVIAKDPDQSIEQPLSKAAEKLIGKVTGSKASPIKQIFTYLFEYVYREIGDTVGHLDILGEMYSEFLKYAMPDGKELGIVLTPSYVTKLMATLIEVDEESKVMDLAAGSAGFLISAMQIMIDATKERYSANTKKALSKIENIKSEQLLGVEKDPNMYALATTNMILRNDGSSRIEKGDTFTSTSDALYREFNADRLLLNPPFSFRENGMPFLEFGLTKMAKGGLAAIIVQDSAGSGQAVVTNKKILKKNQLLASIKMPPDLFAPVAGVQTSIYVFRVTGKAHDYAKTVRFIDFRNDGYKRTSRSLYEIGDPQARYRDLIRIYHNGLAAEPDLEADWGDLSSKVLDAKIDNSGADWNFDQHWEPNTEVTFDDLRNIVEVQLKWEAAQILKRAPIKSSGNRTKQSALESLEAKYQIRWKDFVLADLFGKSKRGERLKSTDRVSGAIPFVTAGETDEGISAYVSNCAALFPSNTITIDMFGSAKYRNYSYGADDHVAVIRTQLLKPAVVRYLAIAIHKSSHSRGYDFSRNFYPKDADNLKISLPVLPNGKLAGEYMEKVIHTIDSEQVRTFEAEQKRLLDAFGEAARNFSGS